MQDPPVIELTEHPHPSRTTRWGPWKASPGKPQARRLKLLLLHGFAGSPAEMRPLGQAMLSLGFSVVAPLLPGHGENLEARKEVRLNDWLEAATLTYESLRRDDSPVGIVGYCLGGALALQLASRLHPRAVCCLSVPAGPLSESAFPALSLGLRSNAKNINDSSSAEVCRWRALGCHQVVPDSFLAQYQELLGRLGDDLGRVACPLLVAQARHDAITPAADAERILEAVKSERRKLVWSRKAGHALPVDVGRRALFSEVANFLVEADRSATAIFAPE